ncbi:MAG: T9SS type A sorting domain-containing protein, partial [Hymenobacter sp.]
FVGTNQTISGGTFANITINGGGVKSLQTSMNVTSDLTFVNGLLATDVTQPLVSVVILNDRSSINGGLGGRLLNETDNAYLRGLVTITHSTITLGTEDTFGGIGLALTYSTAPGAVTIARNTAAAYAPGNGAASGVRRIFDVSQPAADPNTTIRASVRFSYLDGETKNLGANGNINIDENDLTLYVTTNKGNTFTDLGRSSIDTNTNNLIDNNVTAFAIPTTTFTLGDRTNPLPVELIAFDAKRSGANALITWATASERNSAGFEVQASTDGQVFKKLTFVASSSANSSVNQSYSYTDTEAGKSGVRYYRLRQIDLDGQYAYSPTRAVSFAAATDAVAALSAYPSPFTTTDQAALVLQAPTAGTAQLQLMDMMGRTLTSREFTTIAGISEVPVPNASNLAAGSYLVKVTFATGEVKTLRIQKK